MQREKFDVIFENIKYNFSINWELSLKFTFQDKKVKRSWYSYNFQIREKII